MIQDTSAQVSELQGLDNSDELELNQEQENISDDSEIVIEPMTPQGKRLNQKAWRTRNRIMRELYETGKRKPYREAIPMPEQKESLPFVPMTLEEALSSALSKVLA